MAQIYLMAIIIKIVESRELEALNVFQVIPRTSIGVINSLSMDVHRYVAFWRTQSMHLEHPLNLR